MTVNELAILTHQFRGWAFKHYGHAINLQVYLNHEDFRNLRRELMYGPYTTIIETPHYFEFEGVVISRGAEIYFKNSSCVVHSFYLS